MRRAASPVRLYLQFGTEDVRTWCDSVAASAIAGRLISFDELKRSVGD